MKKIMQYWPIGIIFLVWFIFSSPFFLKGLAPFPSHYQANAFSPWSAYGVYQGPIKNSAMPDIITQIYPWRHFTIESLRSGEIPLWNPYSFSGTPHLANFQSAALFPLNIVFFLPLGFVNSWSILVLLQPLLAGIGMFVLSRNFRLSNMSSLISAISFMFCGFLVSWMGYATLGFAILFLPFAFFAINKIFEGKLRYGLILPITILTSLFAGHFQTSVYFLGAVFLYITFLSLSKKDKKSLLYSCLFFLSGVLISMPQILPSVEFYFNSVRQDIVTQLEVIPLSYLPTLFAPDFYGNPVTRNDWFGHYAEWNGYTGVIAISLCLFAAMYIRRKVVWFFIGLGLVSLFCAYNTPINSLLFNLKLPLFSTSASSRIIVLFSFSASILAAFGHDYFTKNIKKTSFVSMIRYLSTIVGVVVVLWLIPFLKLLPDSEKNLIAQNNLVLPTLIFLAFAFCVIILKIINRQKVVWVSSVVIAIILSIDMLRFSAKWMPFDPKDLVFKNVGITEFFEKNKTNQRYIGNITAENSVYYRLQALGGYDPLYPERYGEFVKYIATGTKSSGERSVVNFPLDSELVDKSINFLGAGFVMQKRSDDNQPWGFPFDKYPLDRFGIVYEDNVYRVFRNNQAYERAFVVTNYVVKKDDDVLSAMFGPDIDLRKTAVLGEEIEFRNVEDSTTSAKIIEYANNRVVIETTSTDDGIVILTDNYYPGWKAFVNGNEKDVLKVDYNFRGVQIPKGNADVTFIYDPRTFRWGIYLSIVGILVVIIIYIYQKKYERAN